jgi:uncharacterized protein YodC (DUF2158 family)
LALASAQWRGSQKMTVCLVYPSLYTESSYNLEANMTEIKKGDVVQLKSGGPKMTVTDVGNYGGMQMGPENGAKCTWFEGAKPHERVFDVAVLNTV